MNEKKIKKLDEAVVKASKKIKVLNTLAWPAGIEETFLENWHKGKPQLPEVKIKPPDVQSSIKELDSIVAECDQRDPVEKFLADTAESYADAGRMLLAVGTTQFTTHSTKIYG